MSRRPKRQPIPGDLLLEPMVLAAVGTLILNDHILKARWSNAASGKLSDFAGLFFFPFLLIAIVEIGRWLTRRESWSATHAEGTFVVVISAVGFASIKLWSPAGDMYQWGMGALQWPLRTLNAFLSGEGFPGLSRVQLVMDPTDLMALPVLLGSWILLRHRVRSVDLAAEGLPAAAIIGGARPSIGTAQDVHDGDA